MKVATFFLILALLVAALLAFDYWLVSDTAPHVLHAARPIKPKP